MEFQTKNFRERLEYILIFTTAGISLIIAILDLSGVLDANSWVAKRVPSLTLLAVGFIASYLILERQGKLDTLAHSVDDSKSTILAQIEDSTEHIIKALDGVSVTSFANGAELNNYVAKRFKWAKRIDDVNWGNKQSHPRSYEDIESFRMYGDAINIFAKNPTAIWREVVVFHQLERFEREKTRMLEPNNNAYNVRFYEIPTDVSPNLQGFTIVDNEELLMSHSRGSTWLSIKHPAIVKFFGGYFEDLWQDAKTLKEGRLLNQELLNALEARITKASKELNRPNVE